MVGDLRRISSLVALGDRVLTMTESMAVASYARTLSGISRDRRRSEKTDNLSGKSMEELAELARGLPELRDLLGGGQ